MFIIYMLCCSFTNKLPFIETLKHKAHFKDDELTKKF